MQHIISYSGGMTSFAEAKACCVAYSPSDIICLFADTKSEDPDLYRFLNETITYLGVPLVTISEGRTLWELFKDNKFIGNHRIDLCSRILKRDLLKKWITTHYTPQTCEIHLGLDFTEYHRLSAVQLKMKPWVYRSCLIEQGQIIPKDYSLQFGIKPPYLYSLGVPHNNCGGFCVKAGLGQFKLLYEKFPERYAFHEEQEQVVIALGGKPFLRKMVNYHLSYISLKEYREKYLVPKQAEAFKYDFGGCGCAID